MYGSVGRVLALHQDQSPVSGTHVKKASGETSLDLEHMFVTPVLGKQKWTGLWDLLASQSSLLGEFRDSERPCL